MQHYLAPQMQLAQVSAFSGGNQQSQLTWMTRKTPSDGLSGKTDEDNFGFTYDVLNKYIRTGVCEDEETKKKIDWMHEKNRFKLEPMPCFVPRPSDIINVLTI